MNDYVGLDLTDIAACYRHRGLQIADDAIDWSDREKAEAFAELERLIDEEEE